MFARLAMTVLAGAAVLSVAAPTAAADPCPDVELLFARGTAEPPGMGRVGDALADTLRPLLGGRSRFGSALSSTSRFAGRAIDVCSQGDPICSAGRDRSAFSNYELPPYPGQAAGFIAGRV